MNKSLISSSLKNTQRERRIGSILSIPVNLYTCIPVSLFPCIPVYLYCIPVFISLPVLCILCSSLENIAREEHGSHPSSSLNPNDAEKRRISSCSGYSTGPGKYSRSITQTQDVNYWLVFPIHNDPFKPFINHNWKSSIFSLEKTRISHSSMIYLRFKGYCCEIWAWVYKSSSFSPIWWGSLYISPVRIINLDRRKKQGFSRNTPPPPRGMILTSKCKFLF